MSNLKPFSKHVLSLEIAATKRMDLLAKNYQGVISLAQGVPSFATPDHIKQAAKKAIDEDLVGKYATGYGIEPLREAVVRKLGKVNNIKASKDQIIVTHGGIEALMSVFLALFNQGDEVIVLTPDYASHITQISIVLGKKQIVEVPLTETEDDWKLDPELLEKAVTPKTKAILLCNPTNPTGKVYSFEELKEIAKIVLKHNLYIIADDGIYEYFVYDGKKHINVASFPEVADRTVSIFSVSKTYAMTGWRIGYIVAKKELIDTIFKVHDSIITCPTVVAQYAALEALTGPQEVIDEFKMAFETRRNIVVDELKKSDKVSLVPPQGTYYAFPKILGNVDDEKLALDLIEKAKVAVIPGSAFGKGGESHLRISFGCEEEKLREGLKRLVGYLSKI